MKLWSGKPRNNAVTLRIAQPDEKPECTSVDEASSLLSESIALTPSYDSMPRSHDALDHLPMTTNSELASSKKCGMSWINPTLSSALIVGALFALASLVPAMEPRNDASLSQMLVSELVFAPEVADETTTFQSLARSMMPVWYAETVSLMSTFTPTVTPGHVYRQRKIILKTRDLLDACSPVYPNTTAQTDTGINSTDMWHLTRHYLNWGYMIVGEFQDLHNAHIMYSQEQMEALRNEVLEWKNEFEQFRLAHNVPEFLSSPSSLTYRHKESHLFWETVSTLPSGTDSASSSLKTLGAIQLQQVLEYLWSVFPYASVLDEDAHFHYHNLRKELRSVVDEYELFGNIMYPKSTPEVDSCMTVLTRARKLLGDINDDWTCYSFYVDNDEYYNEQERLARAIDVGWAEFQVWVHGSNLEGAVQYLLDSVSSPTQPGAVEPSNPSLDEYLKERKKEPTNHIVIGNKAGDADSIVSAISLAYIESTQESIDSTPIVSIPKADLATQRPEVKLLMELSGILNATNESLFVDDPLIENDMNTARVTLVDHNVLAEKFHGKNWTVVEIVDHHEDQGHYLQTCSGNERTIAFAHGKALVASACTLVAERLSQVWTPPYPPSVGLLLLGVILLDSVGLSKEVGKVTQRDIDAVAELLMNTDWQELPETTQNKLGINTSLAPPDIDTVFDLLQGAKYDSHFWKSLSVKDCLRYDYKEFSFKSQLFGVSTVLVPLKDFFSKSNVGRGILLYMDQVEVDFLGIMFAFEDDGNLCRQLAFCGRNGFSLDDVGAFLHSSGYYRHPLDLKEIKDTPIVQDEHGLSLQYFDQRNLKPSRKQIGPILVEYFQSISNAEDQDLKDF